MSCAPGSEIIIDSLFYVYLFWAAWQDHKEKLVLRGTHFLGFAAVLLRGQAWKGENMSAFFLCLACETAYSFFHLYGLADSLVFINCSLYMLGKTDAFLSFFLFWWLKACSGLLLLGGEMIRCRRVTLRLKEPRAYIPWILGAFALTNALMKGYNV